MTTVVGAPRGRRQAGCGAHTAIHLRRPVAEREAVGAGVRRGRRPEAEKGAAQKDRIGPHSRSLCWTGGGHSLPGAAASGRRCGKLGFRRDGELRDRKRSGRARTGEGGERPFPASEATEILTGSRVPCRQVSLSASTASALGLASAALFNRSFQGGRRKLHIDAQRI